MPGRLVPGAQRGNQPPGSGADGKWLSACLRLMSALSAIVSACRGRMGGGCDLLADMSSWPASAEEFRSLSVGEMQEQARRRIAQLEAELAQMRSFVESTEHVSALIAHSAPEPARVAAAVAPPAAEGATIPERVVTALRATGGPGMTARELTEALFGPDASRATLEGVRKAALRLVSRGLVRREDGKTFIAVEVSD